MATKDLDTPFRPGERVQTTAEVGDVDEGAAGKVRLANGLGPWRRYWVRFEDGRIRGQISHEQLVRPNQVGEWLERERLRAELALRSEEEAAADAEAADTNGDGGGGGGGGIADQIPAHLLERSRAAKARLLGS